MCFVWIWEQTVIISLYSINWLVFIAETVFLLRGTDWVFKYRPIFTFRVNAAHREKHRLGYKNQSVNAV